MLRFLTAGESHGKALVAILEGMPAGIVIEPDLINKELKRRWQGYGRGERRKIEQDRIDIISGIRKSRTIGNPISIIIKNKDFSIDRLPQITKPRPGHADLAGSLKYGFSDIRDVLERASARETAARVAVGAICKRFLNEFGIKLISHVIAIGKIKANIKNISFKRIFQQVDNSKLRCMDKNIEKLMIKEIDKARLTGDTLGGVFEVIIAGLPAGIGSYVHYDRRLDKILAGAVMSIPSIKAVEIGDGILASANFGSKVHDEIFYSKNKGYYRKSNFAGGLEGGVTNGETIVIRGYVKPISTLKKPLQSVDMKTKRETKAQVERADICIVASCGVIAEAMCAFELSGAFLEKFGSDSLEQVKRSHRDYIRQIR